MPKKFSFILRLYFVVSGILFLSLTVYFITDKEVLSSLLPKPAKTYPAIGFIESASGDARVRSAGELLWLPSSADTVIYDNDSVFTGPNGKMIIILSPNIRLQVNKDSLFKVSKKNHLTIIQLIQGEMKTSSTSHDILKVQREEKSKLLKLNEVEETLSAEALKALPVAENVPHSLELMEALDDPSEASSSSAANENFDSASLPPSLAPDQLPPHKDTSILTQEGNRQILWILGFAYALFSFIALREISSKKNMPI